MGDWMKAFVGGWEPAALRRYEVVDAGESPLDVGEIVQVDGDVADPYTTLYTRGAPGAPVYFNVWLVSSEETRQITLNRQAAPGYAGSKLAVAIVRPV